jgi:uncharacterized protein (TIGR01777 family)
MAESFTYVIAGGRGLIGAALCRHWLAAGHRVVVLTRRGDAVLPAGAEAVVWDGTRDGPWRTYLDAARAIVNLCGEGIGDARWTTTRKRQLLESRVAPTAALVDAVRRAAAPPVFVQASGVGYYGTADAQICTEALGAGGDFLANLSRQWEAAAAPVANDTRLVIARIGVVLAAAGGAFPKLVLPLRLGIGGPIASGCQWLSWIHLADLVAAIDFLTRRDDLSGAVNCVAPQPIRNRDAARILGRALRRPVWLTLPRFALELALGEMATLVCDGQRAEPARLNENAFPFRYPTFAAAAGDLLQEQC